MAVRARQHNGAGAGRLTAMRIFAGDADRLPLVALRSGPQELGHNVLCLTGHSPTRAGDPTEHSSLRPVIPEVEIRDNGGACRKRSSRRSVPWIPSCRGSSQTGPLLRWGGR
ncbi:MAG: hypothetical protein HY332_15225 [Chloroflexi bacterium]|nr:hypothetical protein [Chloroflexota bacterium]